MNPAAQGYAVQRAMQAMEVLAFRPASAREVAEQLKINPRTARRLLERLAEDGWVARANGQRRLYAPTMRIVALSSHLVERAPLAVVTAPEVEALHVSSGAIAHLFIPSYRSVLCLVHRADDACARPAQRELAPAHGTASGKVLLAHREEWRDSVFELPLERITDRTIVDPAVHRDAADSIARDGFGWDEGEYRPDLCSVAAPVADVNRDVVAALGVTVAQRELSEEFREQAEALVVHHARRASAALGAYRADLTSSGSERSEPR